MPIKDLLDYTGKSVWNAIYTVQLGELAEKGVFDWEDPLLDWSNYAYNAAQYKRVCEYFLFRFEFREISLEPFYEWARRLYFKLVYELMPKYKPLYERADEGINPLQESDEYFKRRTIDSDYPETQLSANSDYASFGTDEEYERVKEGNISDNLESFGSKYKSVDEMLLDELECMFIGLYTVNANVL